jgi:hypothetical protein
MGLTKSQRFQLTRKLYSIIPDDGNTSGGPVIETMSLLRNQLNKKILSLTPDEETDQIPKCCVWKNYKRWLISKIYILFTVTRYWWKQNNQFSVDWSTANSINIIRIKYSPENRQLQHNISVLYCMQGTHKPICWEKLSRYNY